MKKKIIYTTTLCLCLGFVLRTHLLYSQEKEYFIGAPLIKGGAAAGKSVSHWQTVFDKSKGQFEKELKAHLGLKIFPTTRVLMNEIKKGNVHLAIFGPTEYVIAKKEGIPVKPFIALVAKATGANSGTCIYVRKDSGIKNINDLKGKKLGIAPVPKVPEKGKSWLTPGTDTYGIDDWIFARRLVSKTTSPGKPVDSFFGQVVPIPSQESGLYVLLSKKIDAAITRSYTWVAMKLENKSMSELKPLLCEGGTEQPFIASEKADKEFLKKFKKTR